MADEAERSGVRLVVTVSPRIYAELKRLARRHRVSMAAHSRLALAEYLEGPRASSGGAAPATSER
jgi:hypothetical protein